jgi:hypothetical protein
MAGALSCPNEGGGELYVSYEKHRCLLDVLVAAASQQQSLFNKLGKKRKKKTKYIGLQSSERNFKQPSQPIFIRDDAFQQPTFRCEFILWFDIIFRIAQIKIIIRHCLALEMNKHTMFAAAFCCLFLGHSSIIHFAGLNNCNFL